MASSASTAQGTLLKRGDGQGSETFTTVAEVVDIGGPDLKANTTDVTSHDSTSGWVERLVTTKDGGEIKVELNYLPGSASHGAASGLLADYNTSKLRNWKIVFPVAGSPTYSFAAYITGFSPKAPATGKLGATMTLSVSGPVTLA